MKRTTITAPAVIFFILLSCVPFAASAAGSREQPRRDSFTSYIVYPAVEKIEPRFLEQYYGNSALASFFWTDFTYEGESIILAPAGPVPSASFNAGETDQSGEYAILKAVFTLKNDGGTAAGEASVTAEPDADTEQLSLTFTTEELANDRGTILYQPSKFALLKAARQSGAVTGQVRLERILWNQSGHFSAVVSLR